CVRTFTHQHHPFSLQHYAHHRDLHSFPTRRSSDLKGVGHGDNARAQRNIFAAQFLRISRAVKTLMMMPHIAAHARAARNDLQDPDRKSTRLNSSHSQISYAVFCLKKKNKKRTI